MEVQTESSKPPPVEPQSSGKINKAAFKLFGKRRSGGGMPSIFSMRNKGEGGVKAAGKALELVRSKTHDGITSDATSSTSPASEGPEGAPGRPAESASSDQLHGGGSSAATGTFRSSLSKSLSFFSLLRRNSVRGGDGGSGGGGGGATGTVVGRRSRGLRGFFSSLRWRRKERPSPEETAAASGEAQSGQGQEAKESDVELTASHSGSVEVIKENVTLTLAPDHHALLTEGGCESGSAATAAEPVHSGKAETQGTRETGRGSPPLTHSVFDERSPDVSPLRASGGGAKLGSPARLASDSAADSCMTPPLDRSLADPPSEPSVDRLCSMFNDVTSLKSFDSLTGCGDIIADVEDEPGNGNGNGGSATSSGTGSSGTASSNGGGRRPSDRGSPAKPPLASTPVPVSTFLPAHQLARAAAAASATSVSPAVSGSGGAKKPAGVHPPTQGSGVVAYMGGGEEMASPEGVDDADMQGMWHMLPQKGDDSPDLPRSEHGVHHHHAPAPAPSRAEKQRTPPVKGLGLSKIPVSGSGRSGKQQPTRPSPPPMDKELQDAPPSDEGYWDSPTPVAEDDDGSFLRRELRLPRESCSGDALYDLYDPDSPGAAGSEEDDMSSPSPSTGDVNLSPQSQAQSPSSSSSTFRSLKGSTSLPRDSKIPVSVRHTPPPHSSSQGELSSATSPASPLEPPAKTAVPPPRTRIPVSKVPVRRSAGGNNNNKPASATRNRK